MPNFKIQTLYITLSIGWNISVMTSEKQPDISVIKTHECKFHSHTSQEQSRYIVWAHLSSFLLWTGDFSLYWQALFVTLNAVLSKAQMLLRDLQELLDWCSTDNSQQMRRRPVSHKYKDVFKNSDSKEPKDCNVFKLIFAVWGQISSLCLQFSKKFHFFCELPT